MQNIKEIKIKKHTDGRGILIPIEYPKQIDFPIKRIYYIYDVNSNVERGFHSHKALNQLLIAVNGRVKIRVKTPFEEQIILLDDPSKGLYIGPMIWREMFDFEDNAVLLVLASQEYDEQDYIREYEEYKKIAKDYWRKKK